MPRHVRKALYFALGMVIIGGIVGFVALYGYINAGWLVAAFWMTAAGTGYFCGYADGSRAEQRLANEPRRGP